MTHYEMLHINGIQLEVEHDSQLHQIAEELRGPYDLESIKYRPGDVVLDIGAHQGLFSMYLAKRQPKLIIHAFEPVPSNFACLKRNLVVNEVKNVKAHKLAVTADGRHLQMVGGSHSAEGSAWHTRKYPPQPQFSVRSTTLQRIFAKHVPDRCRLLKLDCEGAEHEIVAGMNGLIDRIDYVRGELHMIAPLAAEGWTMDGTAARIPAEKAVWQRVEGA